MSIGANLHSSLATIEIEDAAARTWDVLVVGAGPAGSIAAREISRHHKSVLLVEKARFPRWKVCGCCLNGAGIAALEAVGLGDLPDRLGAKPLRQWRLYTPVGQAACPLPTGVSLSREALDSALVREATDAGVQFLDGTSASLESGADTDRKVVLTQGQRQLQVAAKVVIAADGLSGRLVSGVEQLAADVLPDSRMGAGTTLFHEPGDFVDGSIYMASASGGYVGLVKLEDGRLDVAAALDRDFVRRTGSPGAAAEGVLSDVGLPVPASIREAEWRGTPPLTRRRSSAADNRVFLVGDAVGYIEPFTGEGIAWALLSGVAVAPLAARGADQWSSELASEWNKLHHELVGPRQWSCRMIGKLLRSPRLANVAARVLRRAPWLARPLIRAINRPLPQLRTLGEQHKATT